MYKKAIFTLCLFSYIPCTYSMKKTQKNDINDYELFKAAKTVVSKIKGLGYGFSSKSSLNHTQKGLRICYSHREKGDYSLGSRDDKSYDLLLQTPWNSREIIGYKSGDFDIDTFCSQLNKNGIITAKKTETHTETRYDIADMGARYEHTIETGFLDITKVGAFSMSSSVQKSQQDEKPAFQEISAAYAALLARYKKETALASKAVRDFGSLKVDKTEQKSI